MLKSENETDINEWIMITNANELRTHTCNSNRFLRFFRCNSDECDTIIRLKPDTNNPSTGERNSEHSDNLV